jgi:effector-binding domain-containing protein
MKKYLFFIIYLLFSTIFLVRGQEANHIDYSNIKIGIENFDELTLLSIMDSCRIAKCDLSEKFTSAYNEIRALMHANNIGFTYYPIGITHFFDNVNYKFEAGIPIPPDKANIKTTGRVFLSKTPSGKMVKAIHIGSYDTLKDTYNRISAYMNDKGLIQGDKSFEVYVNSPSTTPEEKLITWIFIPIK